MEHIQCRRTIVVAICLETHGEVVEIGEQVEGTEDGYEDIEKAHGVKSGPGDWGRGISGEVGVCRVCAFLAHDCPGDERGGEVDQHEAADAPEDGDDRSDVGKDDAKDCAGAQEYEVVNTFVEDRDIGVVEIDYV